jgi:hypothetical protein
MTKFKIFKEEIFILWELHSKILVGAPSVVSGYGKRSINLNKVVANFEKHTFLSQTDLTRTGIISNCYNEMFELVIIMDKKKGYVLLLINAGIRSSVSERKNSRRLLHYV